MSIESIVANINDYAKNNNLETVNTMHDSSIYVESGKVQDFEKFLKGIGFKAGIQERFILDESKKEFIEKHFSLHNYKYVYTFINF